MAPGLILAPTSETVEMAHATLLAALDAMADGARFDRRSTVAGTLSTAEFTNPRIRVHNAMKEVSLRSIWIDVAVPTHQTLSPFEASTVASRPDSGENAANRDVNHVSPINASLRALSRVDAATIHSDQMRLGHNGTSSSGSRQLPSVPRVMERQQQDGRQPVYWTDPRDFPVTPGIDRCEGSI